MYILQDLTPISAFGKARIQDLGLYGVESCRGQRHRYQTPLNLLIYSSPFGKHGRVTDSVVLLVLGSAVCGLLSVGRETFHQNFPLKK